MIAYNKNNIIFRTTFLLVSFICFAHLLSMLSLWLAAKALAPALPVAMIAAILADLVLFCPKNEKWRQRLLPAIAAISIWVLSLLIASWFFDFSWDGQWYHQAAMYALEKGWDPVSTPIRGFNGHNDLSILHFPKGPWLYSAAALRTFGNPETGKSLNILTAATALLAAYGTCRLYLFSRSKALALALLLALNPVVWCQLVSYLIDGLLYCYLAIMVCALLCRLKDPQRLHALIACGSGICLVNTKFTGPVFFVIVYGLLLLYLFIRARHRLKGALLQMATTLVLGLCVFGYNPYITNWVQRGHPLYPIMGTAAYPSIFEQTGKDNNELYETPRNMMGKSMPERLFLAHFGRPGNAPYNKEKDALPVWFVAQHTADWKAYYFQDPRVAGFGPVFGWLAVLGFIFAAMLFVIRPALRPFIILMLTGILSGLLLSKHFWWPRLLPQQWLVPLLAVVTAWYGTPGRMSHLWGWLLAVLLFGNALVVASVHIGWEARSAITLRSQLDSLRHAGRTIEIDYGHFESSMEERLSRHGISYHSIPRKELKKGKTEKLTSVVEGYPNMVIYRAIRDSL